MTAPVPPSRLAAPAPAALAAFLRGVERRGAVLAELQCGDAAAGDGALAAAMVDFRAAAAQFALAQWPRTFWARLLAQPRMRYRTGLAMAPGSPTVDPTDTLATLGSGPRVALLLRLAAGLDEAEAAAVLGVAEPTYRLALRRALPSHPDGRADPEAWQRLREQVHRRIKTLPQERLLRLTRAREAVLLGQSAAPPPAQPPSPGARPRRLLAVLWTLLALCAVAFTATFWWPGAGSWPAGWTGREGSMRVRQRALPAAEAPASVYGHDAGLVAHRDFALLTDPLAEANTRDLDFHSWLAAQQSADADAADPLPLPATDAVPLPADDTAAAESPDEMAAADAPH